MKKAAKSREPLCLRAWWDHVGTANVEVVIGDMGTSIGYMRALRYRRKRPSYDFCQRLIASAKFLTPGFAPDLELLMVRHENTAPTGRPPGGPKIEPSREFLLHHRELEEKAGRE